jgi:hypothetical protein
VTIILHTIPTLAMGPIDVMLIFIEKKLAYLIFEFAKLVPHSYDLLISRLQCNSPADSITPRACLKPAPLMIQLFYLHFCVSQMFSNLHYFLLSGGSRFFNCCQRIIAPPPLPIYMEDGRVRSPIVRAPTKSRFTPLMSMQTHYQNTVNQSK